MVRRLPRGIHDPRNLPCPSWLPHTVNSDLKQARHDFLNYLRYNRGAAESTRAGYRSDVNIWHGWLDEAEHDWKICSYIEAEQFIAWQQRTGRHAHIIARRVSALTTFYRWAKRQHWTTVDPFYRVELPKRPRRLPVWLEREEQQRLEAVAAAPEALPPNLCGNARDRIEFARHRYAVLFALLQNSGLRISEALALKVGDVRVVEGQARSVRVIGKGDKERVVPLPVDFGQELGAWISERLELGDHVFGKWPGESPPSARAVRDYLNRLVEQAGIDKPITPHKLRHTYATRLLESGAELVDIQALLGHANLATTQIYTHVSDERMASVVARL
jgi:integrase/recombinase XerD